MIATILIMVKKITSKKPVILSFIWRIPLYVFFLSVLGVISVVGIVGGAVYQFEQEYKDEIYPGVRIDGVSFSGKTQSDVENYFASKNKPLGQIHITLSYEDKVATISGSDLAIAYDAKLSAVQAYSVGRSGSFFSDTYQKWRSATYGVYLSSVRKMNRQFIDEMLSSLATSIDVAPNDAKFQFEDSKVTMFKISEAGRKLDKDETRKKIDEFIETLSHDEGATTSLSLALPIVPVQPAITTENSNTMGIKELIGVGTSTFFHSIPGRIHNVELAASRINGHLVPPDTTFSFNEALGDVSAATGYAQAYIIKNGRTVLGDGGGVCQVSTTLFRALMNAGLPILERHEHSYRVGYYEQDSPPGVDATVFAPSFDLKFKNDTGKYLLLQAKTDTENLALRFEIYGTSDGRKAEVTKPVILAQIPAPPDVFQDDPSLPNGTVKQVDYRAAGAKVKFDYKVVKDGQQIFEKTFYSSYQPWANVFLKGTKV